MAASAAARRTASINTLSRPGVPYSLGSDRALPGRRDSRHPERNRPGSHLEQDCDVVEMVIHSLFRHNALVSLYKKRFYVSSKGLPFLFSIDERMDCHAWYIIKQSNRCKLYWKASGAAQCR